MCEYAREREIHGDLARVTHRSRWRASIILACVESSADSAAELSALITQTREPCTSEGGARPATLRRFLK